MPSDAEKEDMSPEEALTLLLAEIENLPDEEKEEFLYASSCARHLVLDESDPRRFLRFKNWDALSAARGIATYWKRRTEVFGEERAFLPLSFDGKGALSQDDIECIRCGNIARLPNHPDGYPVFVGESLRRATDDPQVRMRAYFMFGQLISEVPESRTHGIIPLGPILDEPRYDKHTNPCMSLIGNTFPSKVWCYVYVNQLPRCSRSFLNSWVLTKFIKILLGLHGKESWFRNYPVYYVKENSHTENLKVLLEKHGFRKDGLPRCLGGTWSYREYDDWIQERIKRDVLKYALGNPGETENTPASLTEVSRCRCQSAMVHLLSPSESELYTEALKNLPADHSLWKEECNIDWFLQYEDDHFFLAARRLARYWQLRSECFGQDQYKRLNQTGDGALNRHEIALLQTGFAMLLGDDTEGRPVILLDGQKLEKATRTKAIEAPRNKCLFYMFSLLMENEKSRTDGVVLLCKPESVNLLGIPFLERLVGSLPIFLKAVHVISFCKTEDAVPSRLKSQLGLLGDAIYSHSSSSRSGLADMLLRHGLDKASLPKCANGTWDYAKFVQWKELRTRIEWKVPMGLSGRDVDLSEFPTIKADYSVIPDKRERERRLNAIHSRRKRDRPRVEQDILMQDEELLRQEQDSLQREHSRLVRLVEAAKDSVDALMGAAGSLLQLGGKAGANAL